MNYKEYLERKAFSDNTKEAYLKDKILFEEFLGEKTIAETERADVIKYMIFLQRKNYSESSIARKIASLKNYFYYALNMDIVKRDPTFDIDIPKVTRIKKEDPLAIEVIDEFIELPLKIHGSSLKGKRDYLIFSLLFLTGINSTDLLEKEISDIDLELGYFLCKKEYVELDKNILNESKEYIALLRDKYPENNYLFVNMYGNKLTRQGLWKIFKSYSKEMDRGYSITSQTLINNHLYYN